MMARMSDLATTLLGREQAPPRAMSLPELIAEAEGFDILTIFGSKQSEPGKPVYHVKITFRTLTGVSLEVESEFRLPLETALRQAIENAEVIRGQFK